MIAGLREGIPKDVMTSPGDPLLDYDVTGIPFWVMTSGGFPSQRGGGQHGGGLSESFAGSAATTRKRCVCGLWV